MLDYGIRLFWFGTYNHLWLYILDYYWFWQHRRICSQWLTVLREGRWDMASFLVKNVVILFWAESDWGKYALHCSRSRGKFLRYLMEGITKRMGRVFTATVVFLVLITCLDV